MSSDGLKRINFLLRDAIRNARPAVNNVGIFKEHFQLTFSPDYLEFLTEADGAEGPIGPNNYISIWGMREVCATHDRLLAEHQQPRVVAFGSDGSSTAYSFDFRGDKQAIIAVPWNGLGIEDSVLCAQSFTELLERLYSGEQIIV